MKNVAICALFAAGVSAIPMAAPLHGHFHHKRDVVWVTETDVDIVTDIVTQTVWVDAAAGTNEAHASHHHPYSTTTSDSAPVETTTSASVAPTSESTSAYVAPTTESTSAYVAPTTTTTSAYVAPTTTTSAYVAPTTTTSAYVAPTTTTSPAYVAPTTVSSVYVAPTTTTPAYVAPTTTSAAPATTSAPSSGGSTYIGQLSYYEVGGAAGSCGEYHDDSEMVVALDESMMDKAVDCGREVAITVGSIVQTATIVDTCPGCAGTAGLDLSPSLFALFTTTDAGIIPGATWSFN